MQTQTTVIRKANGSINRSKTTKGAAIDALEAVEAAAPKAKAAKPRTVEAGKYKGTLCFKGPHGPISMGKDKLATILAMKDNPLVVALLAGDLEDRVEGGDA